MHLYSNDLSSSHSFWEVIILEMIILDNSIYNTYNICEWSTEKAEQENQRISYRKESGPSFGLWQTPF